MAAQNESERQHEHENENERDGLDGGATLELVRAELLRLGRSRATVRAVTGTARQLMGWLTAALGRPALDAVTRADLERYLAARRAAGLAPLSQAAEASRLRAFFRVLLERGRLQADPSADLPPLRARARARRAMSVADVDALLRAASAPRARTLGPWGPALALRDRALLELLYAVGLRSGEAAAARVTDLDLAAGWVLVRPGKNGPPRRLPLPPATVVHLRHYMRGRGGRHLLASAATAQHDGQLLLTREGRPLRHLVVHQAVANAARRAGVPAHPHALRRAVATHLVRAGASLPAVQRLLGHARLTTTAVYVALDTEDLRAAVSVLDLSQ